MPLNIIAVAAMIRSPRWLASYFLASLYCQRQHCLPGPYCRKRLNYPLTPVVITLGVRAFMQYRIRKRKLRCVVLFPGMGKRRL